MRTIAIIGTDWEGADPTWIRQPFTDGGRLHFDRRRVEDWANVFTELGGMARVDTIAIGCRGANDTGAVASLPVARAAYRNASPKPALMPWVDTVGLPDLTHTLGQGPFDFGNPEHIALAVKSVLLFFNHFGDCPLERTPNGKALIAWWGIESQTGHGFVNQRYAQRLPDAVDASLVGMGLVGSEDLLDQSWAKLVPNLRAYAVHDWFSPWGAAPRSFSTRPHNGVTTGVVVPSFYRIIEPLGGQTLRRGLAACRQAKADYVLLESGTNFSEAAELMRDASGDTSKLDAIREHVTLTTEGEPDMDAVTKQPLLDWILFNTLLPGALPDTYALPWNEAKGEPDPSSSRVFSLQKDGTIQTRSNVLRAEGGILEWESGRIIGDKLVFVTEGVAIKVFGLMRGV